MDTAPHHHPHGLLALEPADYRDLGATTSVPTPVRPVDSFDELGADVAAIIRAARDAAAAIEASAEAELAEAMRLVEEAQDQAATILDRARDEAMRICADAEVRAGVIEADAERRGRARAVAAAGELVARLAEATRVNTGLTDELRNFAVHTDAGLPGEVTAP